MPMATDSLVVGIGGRGRGKSYTILTRQIKMPQYLLINRQSLLMHPRRYPFFFFPLPILSYLRFWEFERESFDCISASRWGCFIDAFLFLGFRFLG